MKRSIAVILACILIILLPGAKLLRTTSTQAASPSMCGAWGLVSSPNKGSNNNVLNAVAVVSSKDVWAVGYGNEVPGGEVRSVGDDNTGTNSINQTLIEHWNGINWSIVASPSPGIVNHLNGVAAVSANDVWAVGAAHNTVVFRTLIEHWDGSTWSVVASPNFGTEENILYSVAAVSASDIWAVGYREVSTKPHDPIQTLVEHWNGSAWSIVASPGVGPGDENVLSAVTAVSTKDVWAVGNYFKPGGAGVNPYRTLIEHWNGKHWSIVSSLNAGPQNNTLLGVAAVSAQDVWAVGNHDTARDTTGKTLVEHWNGTTWSIVASPNEQAPDDNYLYGVAVVAANDIWAVGLYYIVSGGSRTVIEQWNGRHWNVVGSPDSTTGYNVFYSIAVVPGTSQAWAVGYAGTGDPTGNRTLIAFYC